MSAKGYFEGLAGLLKAARVTDAAASTMDLEATLESVASDVGAVARSKGKVIFIGNGGSAGIAGHQAVDYWKNGRVRATAFNDASLLTCISNDYGYEHVFEKPIEMFAESKDLLFAISSSGKSENILRGAQAARRKGCRVITFSGFDELNPLCTMGDVNFYVSSDSYGLVEISHLALSHFILDRYMELSQAETHSVQGEIAVHG